MIGYSRDNLVSVIHAHRYFLEEILNTGCALVTLEQIGVSYDKIDANLFFKHYTRTQRYNDHLDTINHFKNNPPENWDGRFVLLGISEGGHVVTQLSEELGDEVIATILWSAAGDHTWEDEVWDFLQEIDVPKDLEINLPQTRDALHDVFEACLSNPTADEEYLFMTNKYMADAIQYPLPNYEKLSGKKILVVTGANDSLIMSSDTFVEKAREVGVEITYHRIENMDHYIRLRPDVYNKTFKWLRDKTAIDLENSLS
ncbi:MAG: alpha/beta hydrolase [bacterium]|nr:alpha/beta hydrolase [bacterium]